MRFGGYLDQSLELRHWISLSMKNGFARGKKLYPAHYSLLYFSKGFPKNFKRPKIDPQKCRKCGEYIKDYGGYKSIIDEKGINLSDFWEDTSPLRHISRKHRNSNELPKLIFDRVLSISGAPNEFYIDPFAGSGSGVIGAAELKMKFLCCDLLESNCSIIANRLENFV